MNQNKIFLIITLIVVTATISGIVKVVKHDRDRERFDLKEQWIINELTNDLASEVDSLNNSVGFDLKELHHQGDQLVSSIEKIKNKLISRAQLSSESEIVEYDANIVKSLIVLKTNIEQFKALLKVAPFAYKLSLDRVLPTSDRVINGKVIPWEVYYFQDVPIGAAVIILDKYVDEIREIERQLLQYILKEENQQSW